MPIPSEAITVALTPGNAPNASRLGYAGENDSIGFTQTSSGALNGYNVNLPGGASYDDTTNGIAWSYTNNHGDTITTADNNGNRTWTGYWGPYGENATGGTPPSDTAIAGGSYGYNGAQGKLTDGNLILMGARPYLPSDGRFIQPDPVPGGCANLYTYSFGDPLNYPDLSGQGWFSHLWHHVSCFVSRHSAVLLQVGFVAAGVGIAAATIATGGLAGLALGEAAAAAAEEEAATESTEALFQLAEPIGHAGDVALNALRVGTGLAAGTATGASAFFYQPPKKKHC